MAMNVTEGTDGTLYYTAPSGLVYAAGGDNVNCTISTCPVELSVYGYRASLPFSILVIVLYAIVAIIQLWLGIRYRVWGFMSCMLLGCITEIIGYVGRIMMWDNPWMDSGFIMQIVLITIAPVFFAAAIYVMIYQIANYISPSSSRFPPSLFYWIFIPCDIISLILQAAGGAMSATSNGGNQAGVNIALAGLAFQVFTLVAFIVAVFDYMWLSRRVWRNMELGWRFKSYFDEIEGGPTLTILQRVYELSEGYSRDSEALRDQPLFIALEGASIPKLTSNSMVIAAAWCLVGAHPGFVFHSRSHPSPRKESNPASESEESKA
ncbi:hypothetical protein PRZ48_007908 [Zasmidium cellare]|uniref:Parasitic phase-specific protein PSP-1 n=1 Tax=Zasmidium cellare TaxID=395010 RepID=A0ABR0EKK4_ZASCE|nr:hypothetical protein PRZ48_007908 [Zasmidium cellare]